MKRILLISFFVLVAVLSAQSTKVGGSGSTKVSAVAPSSSPVTFVKSANGSGSGGGNTSSPAFGSNVVAGHAIVVTVQWRGTAGITLSSVTDSLGNTYTISASSKAANTTNLRYPEVDSQIAYATGITGGACTVTATLSSNSFVWAQAVEVTAAQLDQATSAIAQTGVVSPGSITTGSNGSFGIVCSGIDDNVGSASAYTAGSGWTRYVNDGGGAFDLGAQYQAQTTAGALSGAFSAPTASSQPYAASYLTLKP